MALHEAALPPLRHGGDWRRLTDLVRGSLIFTTVADLTAGLEMITADPELLTLRTSDAKMRLRDSFDAKRLTSGYRDIQLSALVRTPVAVARGVQQH